MTHLDAELSKLKATVIDMWNLVLRQLTDSREALEKFDKDLARHVLANEKRVNAYELKINMDCENILALFNPVANNLRFVLAVLRINYNLERVGDYIKTIMKIVNDSESLADPEDIDESQIRIMFETTQDMLTEVLEAFEEENAQPIRNIFAIDDKLDSVNRGANAIIAGLISRKPSEVINYLNLLSIIRRLERVGDQTKNIAEEIIFYIEAKVVRHMKTKNKLIE